MGILIEIFLEVSFLLGEILVYSALGCILPTLLFGSLVFTRNFWMHRKTPRLYRSQFNFVLFCGRLTKTLKAIDMHTYTVMEPLIPENSIIYYKPFRNRRNNIRKKDIVRKGDYILYNIPADIYYKKYKTLFFVGIFPICTKYIHRFCIDVTYNIKR